MITLNVLFQGWRVGWADLRVQFSLLTYFGGWLVNAFAQVVFFALLAELVNAPDHLRYLLIGNAVAAGCFFANGIIAVAQWDRNDGTYPLLVVAPTGLLPATIGRTSIHLITGTATSMLTLLLAELIFGIDMPWPEALLLVPLLFLVVASVYAPALFLGTIVTRKPRLRNIVHRSLFVLLLTISGVSVPVSYWPDAVQAVANILHLTYELAAVRLLFDGAPAGDVLEQIGKGLLIAAVWFGVAVALIDRMADAGRRDGSIEFV